MIVSEPGSGMTRKATTVPIYLLHFTKPIGNAANPHGQAQHYVGYTPGPVERRIEEHRRGSAAAITAAAVQAGVELILVRTWPGDRDWERRLKRYKKASKLCPLCSAGAHNRMKR